MIFDNQCRVENDPYRAERMAWQSRYGVQGRH